MAVEGMDTADRKMVNRIVEQIRVALTRRLQAGVVRREQGPGRVVWPIVQSRCYAKPLL